MNAPRGTTGARRPRLRDLVLPLLGLVVLLLPFAPILPDRWPVLQILAGPLRSIVWLVVMALMVWVLWQSRILSARWIERWSLNKVTVAIWLATVVLSSAAAARLTESTLFPGGDEPHYLVIAQSLWRDHDLKIENNHTRGDYYEYFKQEITPHYLTRGADNEIYSVHPIGLPVLHCAGPRARRLSGGRVAAHHHGRNRSGHRLALGRRARSTRPARRRLPGRPSSGSTPFLFNTFTVYPEIAAALAVMIALALTRQAATGRIRVSRLVGIGLACGALPWLSTKYAPMSAALIAVAVARVLTPRVTGSPRAAAAHRRCLISAPSPRGSPSSTSTGDRPGPRRPTGKWSRPRRGI